MMTDARVVIDQLLERDSPGRPRGGFLHSTTPDLFCQDDGTVKNTDNQQIQLPDYPRI